MNICEYRQYSFINLIFEYFFGKKKNEMNKKYNNINIHLSLKNKVENIYVIIDNIILYALMICISTNEINIDSEIFIKKTYYLSYERYGYNEYILLKIIDKKGERIFNEGYLYRTYLPFDYDNIEIINIKIEEHSIFIIREKDYYQNKVGNWIYNEEDNFFEFILDIE
jgi:hypothetical protein